MALNQDHNEWYALLSKLGSWSSILIIGLLGKISYHLMQGKKLAWYHWLGISGLSIFVGYLSMVWCDIYGMHDQSRIIGPIATFFGDKIIIIFVAKHKEIFNSILKVLLKK